MKRVQRFWHRLIWSLLLPGLAAALLLEVWLRPPALPNPRLPPALENAAVVPHPLDLPPTSKSH